MDGGPGDGHREVPPDVTTGRVVVVVGADVVGVVLGTVCVEVDGTVVEVDGTVVDVVPVVLLVALAPGCSSATTRPTRAVAPAAATIVAPLR
jgi:hypothetical protein